MTMRKPTEVQEGGRYGPGVTYGDADRAFMEQVMESIDKAFPGEDPCTPCWPTASHAITYVQVDAEGDMLAAIRECWG